MAWYNKWAILTALAAIYTLIHEAHPSFWPTTASDWAAWMGAVGTIAAVVTALWVAGQQERARRQIEKMQANIVAAGLYHRIHDARRNVECFAARFIFHESGRPYLPPLGESKDFLASQKLIVEQSELVSLAGLGGNHAARLAFVIGMLVDFRESVRRNSPKADLMSEPLPPHVAEKWKVSATEISDRLRVLERICEDAAKLHAPEPTGEEMYGPGYDDDD